MQPVLFLLISLLDADTCHKEENERDPFIPPQLLHPSQLSWGSVNLASCLHLQVTRRHRARTFSYWFFAQYVRLLLFCENFSVSCVILRWTKCTRLATHLLLRVTEALDAHELWTWTALSRHLERMKQGFMSDAVVLLVLCNHLERSMFSQSTSLFLKLN